MSMIPIDQIHENGTNTRRTPATAEEDAQMLASIRAQGILEPLLVRTNHHDLDAPPGYELVFGHRRLRLAGEAGLIEVPAEIRTMTDAEALAAQIAENTVRAAMPPYDQWRAMARLLDAGTTLPAAAAALGLSDRRAAQLEKLGRMHPDVLAAIEKTGTLPAANYAATIAMAPQDTQRRAIKHKDSWQGKDYVSWHHVASLCSPSAISRSVAIFDPATAKGVTFEEDLFAEPGSPDQFTTRHVEKFLQCQAAALGEQVEARKAKKEQVEISAFKPEYPYVVLPKGWSVTHHDAKKKLTSPTGPRRFIAVATSGRDIGKILELTAEPPASRAAKAKAAAQADSANADSDADDTAPPAEEKPANGITKAGLEMIAHAKTMALRKHLRDETPEPDHVLAALILAFCADNVMVRGGEIENSFARHRNRDLASQVIDPAGNLVADAPLWGIAAELLARIMDVRAPGNAAGYGSGNAAEWIGNMIGADASLPRFDTADFLAQVKGGTLKELGKGAGLTASGKLDNLRATLQGSLPDYRPTTFGAPGLPPPTAEEEADAWDEDDRRADDIDQHADT